MEMKQEIIDKLTNLKKIGKEKIILLKRYKNRNRLMEMTMIMQITS